VEVQRRAELGPPEVDHFGIGSESGYRHIENACCTCEPLLRDQELSPIHTL
jgi:hypothetical protein